MAPAGLLKVTETSATALTIIVAVLLLFPSVVSVTPGGVLTLATLAIGPMAPGATLTWKTMVTVLTGGRVTEPLMLLPAIFSVVVLAPPATLEPTSAAPLRPAGRLSVKLALVAVLGPALLITKLKVMVLAAAGVAVPAVLTIPKLAAGVKVIVAVTALELGPTDVVSEPAGIELGKLPPELFVTTAETEQLEPGEINVPIGKDNNPRPAVAVGAPPPQVVAAAGLAALTSPRGYESVNTAVNVAVVSACWLVKVITNKDVPPALRAVGLNVLLTVGRLADTASTSLAEQTTGEVAVTHPATELVLLTLAGGVIDAVLVTCVCAVAVCEANWTNKNTVASIKVLANLLSDGSKREIRSRTLAVGNVNVQAIFNTNYRMSSNNDTNRYSLC